MRQGYYWLTLHRDADQVTRTCHNCQIQADVPQKPPTPLMVLRSLWSYSLWGLDLIGPLPTGREQAKYAIVSIDYCTKWIEVEPLATISKKKTTNFVSIIFFVITAYLGLSLLITTNNLIILVLELFVQI